MRYEKSDRIQPEIYCCPVHFLEDVLDTLFDESLHLDEVNVIADKYLTETLLRVVSNITVNDFEFELSHINFDMHDEEVDEYKITILNDGEVYIDPAINKDGEYYDCDGFIFAECEVSEDAYNGNNRNLDVVVFVIENEE